MGSIYKRVRKRPIPVDSEIIIQGGKKLVRWKTKHGHMRKAELTDDGQHMLVESLVYYMKYIDEHNQEQIANTGTSEKGPARQILRNHELRAAEIKAGIIDPVKENFAKSARCPIEEHVNDFIQYLKDKGSSESHVSQSSMHLRELIEWTDAKRFCDITRDQVTRFIGYLRTSPSSRPRYGHETRSARTINSYLITIKSFTRWMYESRRCEINPLIGVKKLPETNDQRFERRALNGQEFKKLLEAADNDKRKFQGLDGPARATLYLLAAMTGLRRKELASLTLTDFRLDATTPIVRIQGAYSKNKKTDEIPLHPDVVARLRRYFERTQPADGQPVFPLRSRGGGLRATSKMMQHDCEAAGIPYATSDGIADFHANRVLFITSLCRSNVNLIMAQKLARHSDPKLTSNIYSKVSTDERAAAINGISLRW